MQSRFANIRGAIGILQHFFANAFELAFADVFEIRALGARCGGFVEINWNLVAFPDFVADFFRESNAFVDADSVDGNKRNDVGGAEPRMRA